MEENEGTFYWGWLEQMHLHLADVAIYFVGEYE